MASFDVDYDPASWALVPVEFPSAQATGPREWAARMAAEYRGRGLRETRRSGTLDAWFLRVADAAHQATASVAHDTMWALVARDAPGFLLVAIDVMETDVMEVDDAFNDFVTEASAPRPHEYRPATVTPLHLPGLGDGVQILRHDIDEDRQVCASLTIVVPIENLLLGLFAQSYDLPALEWAVPLCEALVAGAHVRVD